MRHFTWFRLAPRVRQGLLLGALCALTVECLVLLGALDRIEGNALDVQFRIRRPRFPCPSITLLVADDATNRAIGRWPVPRSYLADMVTRLQRARVRTIAFDILFDTPSYMPDDDDRLAHACNVAQRVVQAISLNQLPPNKIATTPPVTKEGLSRRFAIADHGVRCRTADMMSWPLPALQATAPAVGHITLYPDQDGSLRRLPHVIRFGDAVYPSLALATAAAYLGLGPDQIVAEPSEIRLGNHHIPLDGRGQAWINWVGGNRAYPTYTFQEFFDGRVPPEALRDRIVLIGTVAAGTFESRATPFSPAQPAIEFQANALDDILTNRPLERVPDWIQVCCLLAFALLCGALTSPRRVLGGTVWILALGSVLWAAAMWMLSRYNLYLPTVAPLSAGALTYAVAAAMSYRQEWEANWRADAAVATLARGGAIMASGRDRERLQSVIRQTAREALQAREVFLILNDRAVASGPAALEAIVQTIVADGRPILWPAASNHDQGGADGASHSVVRGLRHVHFVERGDSRAEASAAADPLSQKLELLSAEYERSARDGDARAPGRLATHTVVAAPLRQVNPDPEQLSVNPRQYSGALVAIGRRDGHAFTTRDAILLETLAEQAGLALENLDYYEILRRRIELANRDLRAAYQLLSEQSTKLFAAVDSIDDALIVSDERDHAIFINPATHQVLLNATPALGESVPEMLAACGLHDLAELYEQRKELTPEDEEKLRCETTRGHETDDSYRILSAQLTPLTSDDGRSLGAMLVVADITTQRELDKMKSDFVGFVAHELRTPLTSILGYASLLQTAADKVTAEQRKDMTEVIMRHCRRLDKMVAELLDVSRLQAGRPISLRREPVDLADLCARVVHDQRTGMRSNQNVELTYSAGETPFLACVDADRTEQVVINLLSNAVKYSPDGGTVRVRLHGDENTAVLEVADTGMGMTPDQVEQLFQRFYRTPDALARGIKGTGLGLYLVKQLIDAHGGDIEVESARGRGTTFTVTLPRQRTPQPVPAAEYAGVA